MEYVWCWHVKYIKAVQIEKHNWISLISNKKYTFFSYCFGFWVFKKLCYTFSNQHTQITAKHIRIQKYWLSFVRENFYAMREHLNIQCETTINSKSLFSKSPISENLNSSIQNQAIWNVSASAVDSKFISVTLTLEMAVVYVCRHLWPFSSH